MISAMITIIWQRDKLQGALIKELFLQKTDMSYMRVCNIQISSVVMILCPLPALNSPFCRMRISSYQFIARASRKFPFLICMTSTLITLLHVTDEYFTCLMQRLCRVISLLH